MGLFTVASERARMDKLRAEAENLIDKIETGVENFDKKVEGEFESLLGHTPATSPHTPNTGSIASPPTTDANQAQLPAGAVNVTTGTLSTPIAPHLTAEQQAHADSAAAKAAKGNV